MDYEKKYNDALDWMRKIYPTLTGATKEDAEHYFSELKESKDERIRTRLIALVEAFGQGKYKDEMLAYLERQKDKVVKFDHDREQQPAEWSEEDEKMLEKCVGYMTKITPISDKESFVRFDTIKDEECIYWLKSLRPQPHWKPSKEQMKCLDDCVNRARDIYNASTSGYDAYHTLRSLYHDLQKLL